MFLNFKVFCFLIVVFDVKDMFLKFLGILLMFGIGIMRRKCVLFGYDVGD